jgi:hypothetical protein
MCNTSAVARFRTTVAVVEPYRVVRRPARLTGALGATPEVPHDDH